MKDLGITKESQAGWDGIKTYKECGILPSELLRQRDELLEALKGLWKDTKENSGLSVSDLVYLDGTFNIEQAIKKAEGNDQH
ncbi:hypothetical protein EP331_00345 [bacterium]|nr:MAG: hypothetical protein EP331_00345 [bacterium]